MKLENMIKNAIENNVDELDFFVEVLEQGFKLEDFKEQVKVIDRYKNNIKLEETLKNEIASLEINIKRANDKIRNNDKINKQLEEKMIKILEKAFENLSLYELIERQKEID